MRGGLLQRRRERTGDRPTPTQEKRRRFRRPRRPRAWRWIVPFLVVVVLVLLCIVWWLLGAAWLASTIKATIKAGPRPIPSRLRKRPWSSLEALDADHPIGSLPNATEWPLVHIVNTRFMQDQGKLTTLGTARLKLFETFCLPSMVGQTASPSSFLWIVKTDPELDPSLLERLIVSVQDRPNVYVVGSSTNYLVSPNQTGCWRDGREPEDLLRSPIYTGDRHRLEQAMALRASRPVLETRLDADDGLHREYLEHLQQTALRRFSSSSGQPRTRWLYWCTRRHVEWHASPKPSNATTTVTVAHQGRRLDEEEEEEEEGGSDDDGSGRDDDQEEEDDEEEEEEDLRRGMLQPIQHSRLCVTPGITVGYNTGVDASEVPVESHDLLYKHLVGSVACTDGDAAAPTTRTPACLDLVESFLFSAVRARTLTSAGMMKVGVTPSEASRFGGVSTRLWVELAESFSVTPRAVEQTQAYLWDHQDAIAHENLLGQCTKFHSCKPDAKKELRKYLSAASQTNETESSTRTLPHLHAIILDHYKP